MDSQLCDAPVHLAFIRQSIQNGNWDSAEVLARNLGQCAIPSSPEGLVQYLAALKDAVILARASRSNAAASLARVRAAGTFQATRRQDVAESTDFRRRLNSTTSLPSDS